jgi:glycine/D-amino acid oxidase-like deaminating enzyme/nitrite reductase/ring-hydroxylating ferredoxin subunit
VRSVGQDYELIPQTEKGLMETSLLWTQTAPMPEFEPLAADLTTDVVVIGGGLTGITTAYLAKKAGQRVVLLERDQLGGVDTVSTTAHLTCVTDWRLHQLLKSFGSERAQAVWEAGFAAMDQIATNVRMENIDCQFKWVPGHLYAAEDADAEEPDRLRQDAELAQQYGFLAEYMERVPGFRRPGIRFSYQARFHPLQYLRALLARVPGDGCEVFGGTEASKVTADPLTVEANGHTIRCRYVVMATHTPLMGKASLLAATLLQTKLFLYTSYALGAKLADERFPEGLYWDTALPYHYLRVDRNGGNAYAIFGGRDHKTGQEAHTTSPFAQLEQEFLRLFPGATIDSRWSGQVIETADGLPYIGETAERQFAATGFAGNGMTFGTLGAMMAVDALLGRKNPWIELFSPKRRRGRGGRWHYLKENTDYPYYLLRDRFARSEGTDVDVLEPGMGKILNLEGKKVAAYRDENGVVSMCSPVCTHLKCIVAWNEAEKTWDCPCHGSRFKPTGEVLSGPAEKDLEPVEVPAATAHS